VSNELILVFITRLLVGVVLKAPSADLTAACSVVFNLSKVIKSVPIYGQAVVKLEMRMDFIIWIRVDVLVSYLKEKRER